MKIRDCELRGDPSEADICPRCDADTYGGHECERQKSTNQSETLVLPIREGPQVVKNEVTSSRYDIRHSGLHPTSMRSYCEEERQGAQIDQNSGAADDDVLDHTDIEQNLILQPVGNLHLGDRM
jgi:hypothetical protein